jgi:hypothetical protein
MLRGPFFFANEKKTEKDLTQRKRRGDAEGTEFAESTEESRRKRQLA